MDKGFNRERSMEMQHIIRNSTLSISCQVKQLVANNLSEEERCKCGCDIHNRLKEIESALVEEVHDECVSICVSNT